MLLGNELCSVRRCSFIDYLCLFRNYGASLPPTNFNPSASWDPTVSGLFQVKGDCLPLVINSEGLHLFFSASLLLKIHFQFWKWIQLSYEKKNCLDTYEDAKNLILPSLHSYLACEKNISTLMILKAQGKLTQCSDQVQPYHHQ